MDVEKKLYCNTTIVLQARRWHGLREMLCNTPKYTLVVFDMFRVFCKLNLNVS